MSKINIAFYIPRMTFGGAERVIINLIDGFLATQKYIIDLILWERKGEYINDISGEVNVIELGIKYEYFAVNPLISYLRNSKTEVIFSNYAHISLILAKKMIFNKVKICLIFHNYIENDLRTKRNFINHYIRHIMSKYLFKMSDATIVVSKGLKVT